ncbi:hypothetical protein N7490_000029 [Penicillium lividum]|nr:hypothetical protein N7490_000029 [Penicillium lividum]
MPSAFTTEGWYDTLLKFISDSKLPFRILEHPDFEAVLNYCRLSPIPPPIPGRTTIKSHLKLQKVQFFVLYLLMQNLQLPLIVGHPLFNRDLWQLQDSGPYSLYPCKSTTTKCFRKYERKHRSTTSCPGRSDSVEFYIHYACPGKTSPKSY